MHRGPDDSSTWACGHTSLGFTRLAINDASVLGRQPRRRGCVVGAFNGEIYNHVELATRYGIKEYGACDTNIILPLYDLIGIDVIDELDGFYAGVIYNPLRGDLICLRDHMGKKPLHIGISDTEVFICSELKAVTHASRHAMLPKGASRISLETGSVMSVREHSCTAVNGGLKSLLRSAVRKRLPPDGQRVGIFLSGGLDSSIIAALACQMYSNVITYCLADQDSPDHEYAELVHSTLGDTLIRWVPLPEPLELPGLIHRVVNATESFNPSIVSNGLCTYLLAEAARRDGIKVVLTGEGADEIFCGYRYFERNGAWRELRDQLVTDMQCTELRRLDTCTMAHSVEARCPFLDRAVCEFARGLDHSDLFSSSGTCPQVKLALRDGFASEIPARVRERSKVSFDVGSGMRGMVVPHLTAEGSLEREQLKRVWQRMFSFDPSHEYFHRYAAFDEAIDRRGAMHR